jgi:hypothetical protein
VGEDDTSIKEHLGQIASAQFVPDTPEGHQTDHIRGVPQAVEESACPFVESALAGTTATSLVAQLWAF